MTNWSRKKKIGRDNARTRDCTLWKTRRYNLRNASHYRATKSSSRGIEDQLTFYQSARKNGKWRERVSEPSAINGTCRAAQSTYLSVYIHRRRDAAPDTMVIRDFRFCCYSISRLTRIYTLSDGNRLPSTDLDDAIIRSMSVNACTE